MRKIHSSTLDFPHAFYSAHTGELHVTQAFLKNSLYTLKQAHFAKYPLIGIARSPFIAGSFRTHQHRRKPHPFNS